MKAISEKNVAGLPAVLSKMTQRMGLANYAESTITIYVRAVPLRLAGKPQQDGCLAAGPEQPGRSAAAPAARDRLEGTAVQNHRHRPRSLPLLQNRPHADHPHFS